MIRLATDLRFCDSSKPYDKVSAIPLRTVLSLHCALTDVILQRWMNHYRFGDGV